jgi:type II secretory pathway pseudopilin PulG
MKAGDVTRQRQRPARRTARGFTYLGVLFLVMLMGLGLSGTLQAWSTASQRAKERDLLWIGNQYAQAIRAYYQQSPGPRQYPLKLEDLLEDKRFPATRHHLRRLYADPITGSQEWGLIKTVDGRIAGVHSKAEGEPWKKSNFPLRWKDFTDKTQYAQWRFVADVGLLGDAAPAAGTTPSPSPLQANPAQALSTARVVPTNPRR